MSSCKGGGNSVVESSHYSAVAAVATTKGQTVSRTDYDHVYDDDWRLVTHWLIDECEQR